MHESKKNLPNSKVKCQIKDPIFSVIAIFKNMMSFSWINILDEKVKAWYREYEYEHDKNNQYWDYLMLKSWSE